MSMVDPNWFEKRSQSTKVAIVAGGGLILLLAIAITIWLVFGGPGKDQKLQSNIDRGKGQADVLTNMNANMQKAVNAQEGTVNAKGNNTNSAINALGESVNRPSTQFNGKGSGRRFCRDFPGQPGC